MTYSRAKLIRDLIDIQYERNDTDFDRGTFRVRGDVIEIIQAGENQKALRVELFGDEIEKISVIEAVSGHALATLEHAALFPATHYATDPAHMTEHIEEIERDLKERIEEFEKDGKLLEAQRIAQRTRYDIEMMREIGYCQGIENYSRYFDGRKPGDAPYTLLDYFTGDFLVMIDESHVTVPQIRAMYNGDRARKTTLVEYGFRLPSAYDNRPLLFEEFEARIGQTIYVSATPGPYERERAQQVVEQIIRPTGLLDPEVILRPAAGQVDDLVGEIRKVTEKGERVLVTTLTKRMAESLTDYLKELDIKVRYLHSDIQTIERMELLRDLRLGEFDVLVGINLLREGLDLPEVALVAILDADKEGFLRSETSLVQTIGRAARNVDGRVILYGDQLTESMARAMSETNRRRALQEAYNDANGITPESVRNAIRNVLEITRRVEETAPAALNEEERDALARQIEEEMLAAAKGLEFERAAQLRDRLLELRGEAPMKDDNQKRRHRRRERTRKSEH
jgi:excinuclease ABC subunit B